MQKLLLLLVICIAISCKKEKESEAFDFKVSGIEKIDARIEDTKTIKLIVTYQGELPENVALSLQDVPDGITCKFDKSEGLPEFSTNLEIHFSRNIEGGKHIIKIVGTSGVLIKEFPLEINVDKSLSAVFTVYNSLLFDLNNYSSNLVDSALVKIYKDETTFLSGIPDYKEYTRTNGKAYFYKLPEGNYLFTIEKGALTNIVKKRMVNNVLKGFVVAGMFRTKGEIMNSAQPDALPGDLKYRDLNTDNKINDLDLGQFDSFSIYNNELNEKVIWIGN